MTLLELLTAYPLVAEFIDDLNDEAEDRVSAESLEAAMTTFDMKMMSSVIVLAKSAPIPGCEGNIYELIVGGGNFDLELYNKAVYCNMSWSYLDSFAWMCWNG